ncbi:helix-turn-helix domain-containing protein [Streptomyces sp. NPDC048241]|uniref:helix-turn-helix domain-containing protein n=1 Tax=Streptomyces sp. NPDC048241 TaxID=3365521 RepID=UPI00371AF9EC
MGSELLELVKSRRSDLGLSYQSLAAACVDPVSGVKVSTGWVHRLETGAPVTPPSVESLRALAAGLQLPDARLREAAAAQFFEVRLSWEATGEAAGLLAQVAVLPEGQRRALLGLVEVMAAGALAAGD